MFQASVDLRWELAELEARLGLLRPGPSKLLALIADFELRHGRHRRAAELLRQASRRLRRPGGSAHGCAPELERFADLLGRWPYPPLPPAVADAISLAVGYHRLGRQCMDQGRLRDAATLLLRCRDTLLPGLLATAPASVPLTLRLSRELRTLDRSEEAVALVVEVHNLVSASRGEDTLTAQCLGGLADLRATVGRSGPALAAADGCLDLYRRLLGNDHLGLVPALRRCADLRLAAGDASSAVKGLAEAVRLLARMSGRERPIFLRYLRELGWAHRLAGNHRQARACHQRALELAAQRQQSRGDGVHGSESWFLRTSDTTHGS